jgi:hypothetical protein
MSGVIWLSAPRRAPPLEVSGGLTAIAEHLAVVAEAAARLELESAAKADVLQGLVDAACALYRASQALDAGSHEPHHPLPSAEASARAGAAGIGRRINVQHLCLGLEAGTPGHDRGT